MKSKKLGLFLTLALVLTGAFAFAQDAPKSEESPIKISGLAYTSFTLGAGSIDAVQSSSSLAPYYGSIDRVYLKWDHQLTNVFSYHVTLDTQASTVAGYYYPYFRNAFVRAKGGMDDMLNLSFDFGLINTPVIANRNKMNDDRWITSEQYNGYSNLIGAKMQQPAGTYKGIYNGGDGEQSSDMGLRLDIAIMKMVTLSLAVAAGEGQLAISTDMNPTNAGKAWYADLFVEPVKGVYVHGFFRYENVQFYNPWQPTGASWNLQDDWFAGAAVGINMMGIRVGAEFEAGQNIYFWNNTMKRGANNFYTIGAYLNWNLQEIAGFPLLVLGKFTYANLTTEENAKVTSNGSATTVTSTWAADKAKTNDTVYYYVGLGWQFNKYVKLAVIYESFVYSKEEYAMANNQTYNNAAWIAGNVSVTPANSFIKVKVETKF